MKHILQQTSILFAFICMIMFVHPQQTFAQGRQDLSYREFYDDLSPYGQWIDDPSYGYVWSPNAGADFRPYYTSGHWMMTDYGNMWASDYSWGWAPFHYGRWTYNSFYGWLWIPDNEWGPSWVSWRYSNDYYGWAPMGPGISISMSYGNYYPPENWWVFIPPMYIHHSNWHHHHHNEHGNHTIIQQTNFINNTYSNNNHSYVTGPRSEQIQHFTHQPPKVYQVRDNPRQGKSIIQNNQVNVYRPNINSDNKSQGPNKSLKLEKTIGDSQPINTDGKPTRTNRNDLSPKQNQPLKENKSDSPPVQSTLPDKRMEQPIDRTPQPQNKQDQTSPNRNQNTPAPRTNQPENREQPQHRTSPQAQPTQRSPQSQPQPNREAPRSNPPQQRSSPKSQPPRMQSPRQGQQNKKVNGRRSATKRMKKRTQF